jgi:hypothetical protein
MINKLCLCVKLVYANINMNYSFVRALLQIYIDLLKT